MVDSAEVAGNRKGLQRPEVVSDLDIARRFELLRPQLDERARRLWAGAEALVLGPGGAYRVAAVTGLSRSTVVTGMREASGIGTTPAGARARRMGGGRKPIEQTQPGIHAALQALMSPAGEALARSPLSWTRLGTRELAAALHGKGFTVSQHKVSEMLRSLGYRLQLVRMGVEAAGACDDALRVLAERVEDRLALRQPVISLKVRVGRGTERSPVVGADDDQGVVAIVAHGLSRWWSSAGRSPFPNVRRLLLVVEAESGLRLAIDRGGQLERVAQDAGVDLQVTALPPATTRWTRLLETFQWTTQLSALNRVESSVDVLGALIGLPVEREPAGH